LDQVLLLILLVVASLASLVSPYVLKVIIDEVFPKGNYRQLIIILLVLIGTYIIRIMCSVLLEKKYAKVSQKIVADIRSDMLVNILNRPITFFKETHSGEVLFSAMNDVFNIQTALSSLVLSFFTDFLTVVGILIMLMILNFKLTVISLISIPIILFSIAKFTPRLHANFKLFQSLQQDVNIFFMELFKNIRVIKSYNTQQFEKIKLGNIQKKTIEVGISQAVLNSFNNNIAVFLMATGPIIVLIYAATDIFKGVMSIGSLIAFLQYLNKVYSPTISMMNNYNNFNKALVSMQRVEKYITPPLDNGTSDSRVIEDFEEVSFNHVSLQLGEKKILKDINISFKRGNMYAITGKSGSGKTCILNLLCGFLHPTSGEILVDGKYPIQKIDHWTNFLSLVEKENQLFTCSIKANIQYGSFNATGEEINKAVYCAKLTDVIQVLPAGIETAVTEAGSFLSDGQKQRIAVARAFLRNAPIVIFDEATAAFELSLERDILENLKQHDKRAIIIVITHRTGLLDSFDHVYHIDNGTIARYNYFATS